MCSKQKNKIKPQKKTINEMEMSNLSDKQFAVMVIKMLIELGRRNEHIENFNKETENISKC